MSETNGWDNYKIYILDELKDLKEASKKQDETLTCIQSQLTEFKTSQRWELRIMSAVWGLIILVVNVIFGHGSK